MGKKQKFKNHKHKGSVNSGQVLEDLVDKVLKNNYYKGKRFYNSVAENVRYNFEGKSYEIDNIAIRKSNSGKVYAVVTEDKLSNRGAKAHEQLRRHYRKIMSDGGIDKVFLMYCHNYNKEKNTFVVEWYRPSLNNIYMTKKIKNNKKYRK